MPKNLSGRYYQKTKNKKKIQKKSCEIYPNLTEEEKHKKQELKKLEKCFLEKVQETW